MEAYRSRLSREWSYRRVVGGICQPVRGTAGWLLLSGGFFLRWRVNPGCVRQFRRCGWFADEALGVSEISGVQDLGAAGLDGGGGVQAEPAVAVLVVVPGKKSWQCARAASIEANRAGKAGRYFRVLNCASEYGLSRGRRAGGSGTG
jgi:hypothetical protein